MLYDASSSMMAGPPLHFSRYSRSGLLNTYNCFHRSPIYTSHPIKSTSATRNGKQEIHYQDSTQKFLKTHQNWEHQTKINASSTKVFINFATTDSVQILSIASLYTIKYRLSAFTGFKSSIILAAKLYQHWLNPSSKFSCLGRLAVIATLTTKKNLYILLLRHLLFFSLSQKPRVDCCQQQ